MSDDAFKLLVRLVYAAMIVLGVVVIVAFIVQKLS